MNPIRITLEGVVPDFEDEVAKWLKSQGIRRYRQEGSGSLMVLIIFYTKHLKKIRDKLPELQHCYQAILPGRRNNRLWRRGLPEIFFGAAFDAENKRLDESLGRHTPLFAFPSELAEYAKRHPEDRNEYPKGKAGVGVQRIGRTDEQNSRNGRKSVLLSN